MFNPKVKTVSSTSTVTFRNTQGSYYDMIISVQNQTIDQTISITDTEGNSITENPIVLTVPAKVILKDVQVGTITFSDANSYNVIISYIVKKESSGIPYIDIDYQTGYTYVQETGSPQLKTFSVAADSQISVSPSTGKKWILRSFLMIWKAASTITETPQIQIAPSSMSANAGLNLYYDSLDVTAGDTYVLDLAEYTQARSSSVINSQNVTEATVPNKFELYSTETLYAYIPQETADVTYYISFIEVNVG